MRCPTRACCASHPEAVHCSVEACVCVCVCGDAVLTLTPALASLLFSSFCSPRRMLRVSLCARTPALRLPPFLMWCSCAVMECYAAVPPLLACSSLGVLVFARASSAAAAHCPVCAHPSNMFGCAYRRLCPGSSIEALSQRLLSPASSRPISTHRHLKRAHRRAAISGALPAPTRRGNTLHYAGACEELGHP